MADISERLLAQQRCLKVLREVMSAEMELSCDGWKFMKDDLGALSVSLQSDMFGWVGLVSLMDRRESVGTEDGGVIGEDNIGP